MNQAFDFNRWLLLVSKHWSENSRKYLLSLVAMAPNPLDPTQQGVVYFVGLYLAGCLYGNMLFADLSGGPKAIHNLSIPASTLEKLLTGLLYGVLLFFVVYTFIFYLVDIPMLKIANSIAADFWKDQHNENFQPREVVNILDISANEYMHPFSLLLKSYFPIQSAFILGSIYFSRFSFIKTSISLLLVLLFSVFFIGKILHGMLPYGAYYDGLTNYRLQEGYEQGKMVKLPGWTNDVLTFLFKYAFTPVFWVATYFRLKEKEI
jgi:hypothetical protein